MNFIINTTEIRYYVQLNLHLMINRYRYRLKEDNNRDKKVIC